MRTEDLQTIKVGPEDEALKRKSMTGRFPVLEDTEEGGVTVCESLPIARYLSRNSPLFCEGTSAQESK
jgi:glutathione S-transferase